MSNISNEVSHEAILEERIRACCERNLMLKLAVNREHQSAAQYSNKLKQSIKSQRWWAIAYLCWVVREIAEPAQFAQTYPTSWAYKLSALDGNQALAAHWFTLSALLVVPLIFTLAIMPASKFCERAQDSALIGLALAAFGYAYMACIAMRLDIPHIVSSYVGSTVLIAATGLLVACWYNSRTILSQAPACADLVL